MTRIPDLVPSSISHWFTQLACTGVRTRRAMGHVLVMRSMPF
jgi:hypothetical protein